MRIVPDTNVVLSALLWRGTPYQLLGTIRLRGDLHLCSSTTLLAELAKVLARPAATKRLTVVGRSAQAVLLELPRSCRSGRAGVCAACSAC